MLTSRGRLLTNHPTPNDYAALPQRLLESN